MKNIEDLRDRYKGKEIWIIGAGPSLDDFPDDFFDDKISIGLNYTFAVFPKCTFIICCHREVGYYVRDNLPEMLRKCIFTLMPYNYSMAHRLTWPDDFNDDPFWMKDENRDNFGVPKEQIEEIARCISKRKSCVYKQTGTIAHSAIQVAAILGASKITLVGCEHRSSEKLFYAQRLVDLGLVRSEGIPGEAFQTGEAPIYKGMNVLTKYLAEVFKNYGILVRRFYFGKGYEEIV